MPTVTAALTPSEDRSFWDYCVNCGELAAMPPGEWLCEFCAIVTAAYPTPPRLVDPPATGVAPRVEGRS
jgi:hypothetical protein